MDHRGALKIELTLEQQEQVRRAVAQGTPARELTLEQLEDRVAPIWLPGNYGRG